MCESPKRPPRCLPIEDASAATSPGIVFDQKTGGILLGKYFTFVLLMVVLSLEKGANKLKPPPPLRNGPVSHGAGGVSPPHAQSRIKGTPRLVGTRKPSEILLSTPPRVLTVR